MTTTSPPLELNFLATEVSQHFLKVTPLRTFISQPKSIIHRFQTLFTTIITPPLGVLACYVSFDVLATTPAGEITDTDDVDYLEHELANFGTDKRELKISWSMWRVNTSAASAAFERRGPTKEGVVDSKTKPLADICRSMDFRSTMDHGWVPSHGVEFFTLFIQHLHEQWGAIVAQAERHLVKSVRMPCSPVGCSYTYPVIWYI